MWSQPLVLLSSHNDRRHGAATISAQSAAPIIAPILSTYDKRLPASGRLTGGSKATYSSSWHVNGPKMQESLSPPSYPLPPCFCRTNILS